MNRPSLEAQRGQVWSQLWTKFYQINDQRWKEQGPRLREICRLASVLAQLCDAEEEENPNA